MSEIKGKTILVTGGAMGIGRLMAEKCLAEGAAKAVLWDINEAALNKTVAELNGRGFSVTGHIADVSNLESIKAASEKTLAEVGAVDILFNNAGIVIGREFIDHSHEDIERIIRINVLGVMHVARAFLPKMIERGHGHFVNIASAAAHLPVPRQSVYASSKWCVLGWSETLRLEVEALGKDLHVTTICPSYIKTGMFEGAKAPLMTGLLEPEDIANKIIAAVKSNKVILREPFMVKALPVFRGLLPARAFDLVVGKMFGVYKSMDHFVGHGKPAA